MNADVLGPQKMGLLQHRAWDFWLAPKRFESPQLYERLGVLWIKRYVPTGGDYFRKKYGVRVIDIKSNIESLLKFEERTRLYEVIHLGAFIAFLLFSIWQLVSGRTNGIGFVIACVMYVLLILSPVLLLAALLGKAGCQFLALSNWLLRRTDLMACAVFTPIDSMEQLGSRT